MNKNLLKNSWILAGLLALISIIIGLINFGVNEFLKIKVSSGITIIIVLYGALVIGQIYSQNFKEIMPQKLRMNVSIAFFTIQLVLAFLFFDQVYNLNFENQNLLPPLGFVIGITAVISLFIYFTLHYGGKFYLRALEKRKVMKK